MAGRPKKFVVMVKGDKEKFIRSVNKKVIAALEKEGWKIKDLPNGNNG